MSERGRGAFEKTDKTGISKHFTRLARFTASGHRQLFAGRWQSAGYHKLASGLDVSPAHLLAYEEAINAAFDKAIATRSVAPPVFKKRIYPAGLFKFGANLSEGHLVLLRDKQPDPGFTGARWF